MDQINAKFGKSTVGIGASGWQARPAWGMRQLQLSPDYTTDIHALPRARC